LGGEGVEFVFSHKILSPQRRGGTEKNKSSIQGKNPFIAAEVRATIAVS
jgi:hypothetical protein